MSAIIYSDPRSRILTGIGHVSAGIIYDHPYEEYGHGVGHLDWDGRIYSDTQAELGTAVGLVDEDGILYSDPYSRMSSAVAHAGEDGILYGKPYSKVDCAVGQYEGDRREAAAAWYLLVLHGGGCRTEPEPPAVRYDSAEYARQQLDEMRYIDPKTLDPYERQKYYSRQRVLTNQAYRGHCRADVHTETALWEVLATGAAFVICLVWCFVGPMDPTPTSSELLIHRVLFGGCTLFSGCFFPYLLVQYIREHKKDR